MSEKEKRFCIFKENFDTNITEVEGPKYMIRTEAIEKMAKAMEVPYFNDIHASEPDMLEALAEAALDALIKEI